MSEMGPQFCLCFGHLVIAPALWPWSLWEALLQVFPVCSPTGFSLSVLLQPGGGHPGQTSQSKLPKQHPGAAGQCSPSYRCQAGTPGEDGVVMACCSSEGGGQLYEPLSTWSRGPTTAGCSGKLGETNPRCMVNAHLLTPSPHSSGVLSAYATHGPGPALPAG